MNFPRRVVITRIRNTCHACPSQWEGEDEQGRYVYVRYRWGHLSVDVNGEEVFALQHDASGWGGVMSYEELKELTWGCIKWPEYESSEEAS